MTIEVLDSSFCICKVNNISDINWNDSFVFSAKTDDEISVVCSVDSIPENTVACDGTWKAFRISGTLDFSLVGILKNISVILADENIPIFAVSTYNTDYILVKSEFFEKAVNALKKYSYEIKQL